MNTNIKFDYQQDDSALLPVQGTPIAVGATGEISESGVCRTADGGIESFAFTTDWQSQIGDDAVVDSNRRYSLIDLVACSSAFFADVVGQKIAASAATFAVGTNKISGQSTGTEDSIKEAEETILKDLSSFVPQYNYWPVGPSTPKNKNTGFSDGGSLDNTGLLGMLARSDANSIIACYNAETPLGSSEDIAVSGYDKKIAAISTDIPVLFGYQPKPVNGTYILFSDKTPADLKYLEAAQVFESTEFGPLVSKLFAASNGQKSPTVALTSSLKVYDNPHAGICQRDAVDVLWIYNNYAESWIKEISTSSWELADNIRYGRYDFFSDFYNFPNYSTGLQIHLNATQVNALAQYQAWVIHQLSEQIKKLIG